MKSETSRNRSDRHHLDYGNAKKPNPIREAFRVFASGTAHAVGHPLAFVVAVSLVGMWALSGPHFGYSDTWQLVINTSTTIVTFLMVFLIQNTQNRDARAIHLKLDELIRGTAGPRSFMVDLEDCTDEEIERFEKEFKELRKRHGVERKDRRGASKDQIDREPAEPSQ
ncbi:hypothetical protein BH09PLA1_BH09PLA1_30480 [soil metagenome]